MSFYFNTFIFLLLVIANGGRYDWCYDWVSVLLWLNAIPLTITLVLNRGHIYDRGPLFWLFCSILPWTLFSVLFTYSLFNPSHWTIYNNLFSPMRILEHTTYLPTTPNPERSRLFLQFLIGLLIMTLNLVTCQANRRQIRHCLTIVFITGATLAVVGSMMKLTGNPKMFGLFEMREPIAFGTFFYKNHYAYFAVLAAGCGMGLFHYTYKRENQSGHIPEKSIGIALLTTVIFMSILLAEARGAAIVAMPLAIAFIFSLLKPVWQKRRALGALALVLTISGSAFAIYHITQPQVDRRVLRSQQQINALGTPAATRQILRLAAYRDAYKMFEDKPIWGWGVGSFIHIHPIYAGPEFYGKNPDLPVAYEFTHSDYLQSLSALGIAGCSLLFAPFILLFMGLAKQAQWKNSVSIWTSAASGAILVAALQDFTLSAPAISAGLILVSCSGTVYALKTAAYNRNKGTKLRTNTASETA